MLTNFGKRFTNIVHQKVQKGGLVNIVHELWQTVHEKCSPESEKGGWVKNVHELWQIVHERCSPEPIW